MISLRKRLALGVALVALAGPVAQAQTFTPPTVASAGGAGTVTSVATDATLTGGPITGTGTLGLNLTHANTWSAAQTLPNSGLILDGSSTGLTTFASANAGASNFTITVPAISDTLATLTATQALTNKSIVGSEINSGTVPAAQLPLATTGAFGAVKPDGTTITISAGVISSAGSAPPGSSGDILYNNAGATGASAATITAAGLLNLPAGATTGPSISINGAATGFYASAAGEWDFYQSTIGVPIWSLANVGPAGGTMKLGSLTAIGFTGGSSSLLTTDVTICAVSSNGIQVAGNGTGCNNNGLIQAGSYYLGANELISSTAPTISSGFGTSPSVVNSNGDAVFTVNVGTGGSATSGVVAFSVAAAHGRACTVNDLSSHTGTVDHTQVTATATGTVTVGNFNSSGVSAAWVASDVLQFQCGMY